MTRFVLIVTALAALLAAAPSAYAAKSPVPNGTYFYAASAFDQQGPAIVFQATVKGNRITRGTLWSQQWGAITGNVFVDTGPPTVTTYKATTISKTGTFQLGSKSSNACYSGTAAKRRLSLVNCGPQFDAGGPEFTAYKKTLSITPGTYTGTSTATQASDPDGPVGQPTGAVGSVSLVVGSGGIASGTGSFAPVSPTTGLPTGGPQVSVTYGTDGVSLLNGLFTLPSNPSGYDLCGAFLPSGQILGLVACTQKAYLPSVFTLTTNANPS